MYNTSPLFHKRSEQNRFINKISISDEQEEILLSARKKVRQAIRSAFREARKYLKEVDNQDVEWVAKLVPKFMTQGSYAYMTLNSPCHRSQEIDLDDGVYLPMSFIEMEPRGNKEWFFTIVDGALKELVATQVGWKFDGSKDTCARIILPNQAHIDIPLYAIPDERYELLFKALTANAVSLREAIYGEDLSFAKSYLLDADQVHLATRHNGWKKSDPLLIANWFKLEVLTKGKRLRRICRFLKAWRDRTWVKGGPSSLTLMICAAEEYPDDDKDRDDYALLTVANALPERLSQVVRNPTAHDEIVYPRDITNSDEIVKAARSLANTLTSALNGDQDKQQVIQKYTEEYGTRMPQNCEWIEHLDAAAIVRAAPAIHVKAEPLPNTRTA